MAQVFLRIDWNTDAVVNSLISKPKTATDLFADYLRFLCISNIFLQLEQFWSIVMIMIHDVNKMSYYKHHITKAMWWSFLWLNVQIQSVSCWICFTYIRTYFNFVPRIIHVWHNIKGLLFSESCVTEEITRLWPRFSPVMSCIHVCQPAVPHYQRLGTVTNGYIIMPPGQ